jgi:hypothetical protein
MPETTTPFADLLVAVNDGNCRGPGQWIPIACAVWRNVSARDARLLEATVAWELGRRRRAQPSDEAEIRERLRIMNEATAAGRAMMMSIAVRNDGAQ